MDLKKKEFTVEEYKKLIFEDNSLEELIEGIAVRTNIAEGKAIVEYLPVKNTRFYIDVWNCTPRFAMRTHLGKGQMKTEIIDLKEKKAQELFETLVESRDVIINISGHYYIETEEQKQILDDLVLAERIFSCEGFENCDTFLDGACPLSEKCSEWRRKQ